MKKLLTNPNFYFLLILAFLIYSILPIHSSEASFTDIESTTIETLEADSLLSNYSNEFNYYKEDSLSKIVKQRQQKMDYALGKKNAFWGDRFYFGVIGFRKLNPFKNMYGDNEKKRFWFVDSSQKLVEKFEKKEISKQVFDSINTILFSKKAKEDSLQTVAEKVANYYITLKSYQLDVQSKFFIKDSLNFIEYVRIDSVITTNKQSKFGTKIYLQTPILFLTEDFNKSPRETELCIPISKFTHDLFQTLTLIFAFLLMSASIFVSIVMPIKIIFNIAKGKPFEAKNIVHLHFIGYFHLAISVFKLLMPYVLHLIFRSRISEQFELEINFINSFIEATPQIVAGAAVVLIAKAFKKGAALQAQTDLTI